MAKCYAVSVKQRKAGRGLGMRLPKRSNKIEECIHNSLISVPDKEAVLRNHQLMC